MDGAYSALLTFEDGAFASIAYSGYAHFDSDEFMEWIAESGLPKDPERYGEARALLRDVHSREDELALKTARNYGASPSPPLGERVGVRGRWHQQFGVLIASCERGDLRPMPNGVAIYDDFARTFEPLPEPDVPRREVIDELYEAIFHGRPGIHNGEWGMATMEVCLAILQSAREQREVFLQQQVGVA